MGRQALALPGLWALRRRALLASAAAALALPLQGMAMRVSDVPRFASLSDAELGHIAQRPCAVAAGSTVEMVAEIAGLGVPPTAQGRWFVRVWGGPCKGAELNVPRVRLSDERDTPAPTVMPLPPPLR